MAVDIFLKIAEIKGESKDAKHKDEIQLKSFQWGATNKATGGFGGGSGAGKVAVKDIVIKKFVDKSTPYLTQYCCTGKHLSSGPEAAVLTIRKAGDKPLEYLKMKLWDVFISGYDTDCEGELVMETVTLNFSKFEVDYIEQKQDGTGGAPVTAGFDLKANKAM
jgi:type VI secretion system secreted protein Hcp